MLIQSSLLLGVQACQHDHLIPKVRKRINDGRPSNTVSLCATRIRSEDECIERSS
jgi:hypothetical protein